MGRGDSAMNEGDIFRWSYRAPKDHMPYHCRSRIAIFHNGLLTDTYWGTPYDNESWDIPAARANLDLEFIANLNDLEKIPEWNEVYYGPTDFVNLNHANSSRGNAFVRKGAKRSAEKMLQVVHYNIERARSRIASLTRDINNLEEIQRAILAAEDLDKLHLFEVAP